MIYVLAELSGPSVPQALLDLKEKAEEKRRKREERKMLIDTDGVLKSVDLLIVFLTITK